MLTRRNSLKKLAAALALSSLLQPPLATAAAPEQPGEVSAVDASPASETTAADEAGAPDDTPLWAETTLSGDWNGTRKRLYDAGAQAEVLYTAAYLYNATGGLQRGGAYVGHLDVILQFDGEKLIGWKGGSGFLQLISNSGGRPNLNDVGSLMGIDNLEAPVNRTGIFKAWLQQSFLDDKASLRVGLYPIDSEFYVTEASGVFIHPSFGMAAEVANFGSLAGPSIYATSSYGARLRIDPDPAWYAMLAVTRAIPSDRIATAGPNIGWQSSSGSMTIAEVGFSPVKSGLLGSRPQADASKSEESKDAAKDDYEPISKLALGAWRYAPQFTQLVAVDAAGDPLQAAHWGAYVLAEQSVYRVPESNRDLAAFVRYGFTDGKTSTLGYSFSVGLSSRGTFASREKDSFGIALTRAHADSQGRTQLANDLGAPLSSSNETVLEIGYRAQIVPGVVLQPVVQRIFNPNLSLPDSTVAGLRLQLAL